MDVIIKTCTSVNLVTQSKKRIFEKNKSEYTFRTINSIIKSLEFNKDELKNIKIKIYIIDHNSKKEDLIKINDKLSKTNFRQSKRRSAQETNGKFISKSCCS